MQSEKLVTQRIVRGAHRKLWHVISPFVFDLVLVFLFHLLFGIGWILTAVLLSPVLLVVVLPLGEKSKEKNISYLRLDMASYVVAQFLYRRNGLFGGEMLLTDRERNAGELPASSLEDYEERYLLKNEQNNKG